MARLRICRRPSRQRHQPPSLTHQASSRPAANTSHVPGPGCGPLDGLDRLPGKHLAHRKRCHRPEAALTVAIRVLRGRWADAARDEAVLKAPRNWLRKASIGSSGAEGPGNSPSCQRQEAICLNTEGSRATIETTTLWLAPGRLIGLAGCSSPSRMSTRFGSLSSVTHEVRTCSEYWIDLAKAWRSLLALPRMESRV